MLLFLFLNEMRTSIFKLRLMVAHQQFIKIITLGKTFQFGFSIRFKLIINVHFFLLLYFKEVKKYENVNGK